MDLIVDTAKYKKIAKLIAIILFIIGITIAIVEFVGGCVNNEFTWFSLGSFIFHVIFFIFLLTGLLSKKDKISELALTILKVFDGVFYPLLALRRFDSTNWSDLYSRWESITFAIAALFVFLVLLFFVFEKATHKRIYWNLILLFLALSSLAILSNFIVMVVNQKVLQKSWNYALESLYLSFLFAGMYLVCASINYQNEIGK